MDGIGWQRAYVVTFNMHEQVLEMPDKVEDVPRFVFRLGPAIRPAKVVKTVSVYIEVQESGR